MSVTIGGFANQKIVTGLNTYTYTINNPGMHYARMEVSHLDGSLLTASISQTGSTSATLGTVTLSAGASGAPQSAVIVKGSAFCAVGDVITFTLSSSSPIDAQPNAVKASLSLRLGVEQ